MSPGHGGNAPWAGPAGPGDVGGPGSGGAGSGGDGNDAHGPGGDANGGSGRRGRRLWIPALVVALLALAVGGFFGARALLGGDDDDSVAVHLVEATDPGPDPFTTDHSTVGDVDRAAAQEAGARVEASAVESASHGDLAVRELTPVGHGALYGSAEEVCDTDAMAASLAADPAAGEAWAELMGIGSDDVESTLASLSPLVLTRDVAVTNSSYANGEGRWFQAVLEAGTAVLVDGSGTPRVRCSCTNPLKEPALPGRVSLEGGAWDGFDATSVIAVTGAEADGDGGVLEIPVVDLPTGEDKSFRLAPGGETVELDGYLVDDADGVYVVSEDGERTQVLPHPVAAVFDDGEGGLIYQHERSAGENLYSLRDTVERPPADATEANIWHLPAGETEPTPLLASDDPADHWFSLQDVGKTDRGMWAAFFEIRGEADCQQETACLESEGSAGHLLDLATGERMEAPVASILGNRGFRVHGGVVAAGWVWNDHGFVRGTDLDLNPMDGYCDIDCAGRFDDIWSEDRWVGVTTYGGLSLWNCAFAGLADCEEYLLSPSSMQAPVASVAVDGDRALVTAENDGPREPTVFEVDLTVGEISVQILPTEGRTRVLTAPLVRPAERSEPAAPDTETTTSTTAEPELDPEPASTVRLNAGGVGDVGFRTAIEEDEFTSTLSRTLGDPDRDSGWEEAPCLPGEGVLERTLEWDGLTIFLARDGGVTSLDGWVVEGPVPDGAAHGSSIDLGDSWSTAQAEGARWSESYWELGNEYRGHVDFDHATYEPPGDALVSSVGAGFFYVAGC